VAYFSNLVIQPSASSTSVPQKDNGAKVLSTPLLTITVVVVGPAVVIVVDVVAVTGVATVMVDVPSSKFCMSLPDSTGGVSSLCVGRHTALVLGLVADVITGDETGYRAMHFSAKHGIAIACRLSVCPSACDVGEL